MDFLNQGLAQLAELFRSMTPGARIASGLLTAVVAISLAFLFKSGISGPDGYLMGGAHFSAAELPAMEAAFAKAGLSAYSVDGNQIRVPRGQQAAYMGALADAGALPTNFGDYLMDATNNANPFMTEEQRKQMLKTAKIKELSNIIGNMPGIEKAAVMYDVDTRSGLRREKMYTASVMVKPNGSLPLDESRVPMIRHLVAGAVAGLDPAKVTVIDQNGRAYTSNSSMPGLAGGDDAYFERQRRWQQWVEDSIRKSLAYVPELTVTASVELDKEIEHTVSTTKPDDPQKAVPIFTREDSKTLTEERGGQAAGRPGLEAQGPNQAAALPASSASGNKSAEEQSTAETQNVVGQSIQKIAMHPLTPKKISVAVGIPDSYFKQVWRQRNPTPAGQEPAEPDPAALDKISVEETGKIKQHVARVILAPEDRELAETEMNVTVTTFAHLESAPLPEPGAATQALGFLGQYYQPLGLAGLALVSLLMVRSLVRSIPTSVPPAPAAATLPFNPVSAGGDEMADTATATNRLKRRTASGPSLQEELTEIVREDPDAAAKILKSWIGKAG